jgi:hypothetical protein
LSPLAPRRFSVRLHAICLLALLAPSPTTAARAQTEAAPLEAPQPAAGEPKITSITVFPQAASQTTSQAASTQEFVLEIKGTGFSGIDTHSVHVAVLPATGVTQPTQVLSGSPDNSTMLAQFTAPSNYVLAEVALSTGTTLLTSDTGTLSCDFNSKVKLTPQIVPKSQAGNKYGNGVAKNFHIIQISIVNDCPMAIVVPLGGMKVVPSILDPNSSDYKLTVADKNACTEKGILVPFSLDHVTSIYSADRKLTGRRAIYFNTVQALATLGSAVEPFFAHGFTQGVAILGGGFTTASKDILVDMSAEQLQNLTSQSFGSTEQVASHGSLQKFVFVRRSEKCKDSAVESDLRAGKFSVYWEVSPASAQAPTTQNAPAAAAKSLTPPAAQTTSQPPPPVPQT